MIPAIISIIILVVVIGAGIVRAKRRLTSIEKLNKEIEKQNKNALRHWYNGES